MLDGTENPIRFCKPVGEILTDYTSITKYEFLLGIMNNAQLKVLELHGNGIIMIDFTHGSNQYGFQLTPLMVQDSNLEGFPVVILFSTRIAAETFVPFLAAIKTQMPNLMPKVFISDYAPAFYNTSITFYKSDFGSGNTTWFVPGI